MKAEDLENVTVSGSDRGGSIRARRRGVSGASADGDNRNVSGDGGNVSGDGGNVSGDASANASGDVGGASAQPVGNANVNVANRVGADQNDVGGRPSRAERIRAGRAVRLGARDSVAGDTSAGDADGGAGRETRIGSDVDEPIIRLGARPTGEPRSVPRQEKKTVSKLNEVKPLIKSFVETVFEMVASATKHDHWKLNADESKMIVGALLDWLESMPNNEQSRIAEFVNKHLPIINLATVAFVILSDRVRASMAIYNVEKAGRAFAQATGARPAPETPRTSSVRTPLDSMFSN